MQVTWHKLVNAGYSQVGINRLMWETFHMAVIGECRIQSTRH